MRSILPLKRLWMQARALRERLAHEASHDWLTGLLNRRRFEERLREAIALARAGGPPQVLCYLDLDHFRLVNDTGGHAAGDALLRALAHRLQAQRRPQDTLARLGGNEFGVLLDDCPIGAAETRANALRRAIEDFEFSWQERRYHVGASIGLVAIEATSPDAAQLLAAADTACSIAKDKGRNRVHVFHPDDPAVRRRHRDMDWVNRVRRALAEDRLRLFAQPIVAARGDNDEEQYELLLRLEEEPGVFVAAEQFIVAAERYGLAPRLDRWVVATTLAWLRARSQRGEEIPALCLVNVSGGSFADETFVTFVLEALARSGVPPQRIGFEITETAVIHDLGRARHFIERLKARGCRFALDDFGTGMSSLGYLRDLPVDFVKIAGSFVRDIVDNPVTLALVRAIVELSRVLGKQTVAECVESDAVVDALRRLGVDYLQGHRIGLPESIVLPG